MNDFESGEYERLQFRGERAFGFSDWGGVVRVERGQTDNEGNNLEALFFLGGFRNLTAIGERQLPNTDYSLVAIEGYFQDIVLKLDRFAYQRLPIYSLLQLEF